MTSEQETAMYDQPSEVSREELIERTARLIHQNYSESSWDDVTYTDRVWAEGTARKVLALVEEAHTPTSCGIEEGHRHPPYHHYMMDAPTDAYGPGGKHENCYFMEHSCTPANVSEPEKTDAPSAQMSVSGQIPTDDEVRLATLAAVKKGAKSDVEAVRNYREAERVIRAAIPHLHRTMQGEPSDAAVQAALRAYWGGAENAQAHGSTYGMRAALKAAAAVQGGGTR